MSFKAEIKASLDWNWNDGAIDRDRLDYSGKLLLGTGANQAQAVWHAEHQLLPQATAVTLDLTDLCRTILGDTHIVTFLSLKALLIVNESTTGGTLVIGRAQADEWCGPFGADGDQLAIAPDGAVLLASRQGRWAVDQSERNLKLAAAGGDVTYSLALLGTTTAAAAASLRRRFEFRLRSS